jgi:transposase
MPDKRIVGIDVAKDWLDIAFYGEPKVARIANDCDAIEAWLAGIGPHSVVLAAFEPTGGYERTLRAALQRAGVMFAKVHPNDVIAFRKSRGVKAKTDRIDARLLAAFAAEEVMRRGVSEAIVGDEVLRELSVRRRQLVEALQAERCRQAIVLTPAVRANIEMHIQQLQDGLREVEAALKAHLRASCEAAQMAELLQTLIGVGPITATTFLAEVPELGRLSGKEIAALIGLAPQTRESGRYQGHAFTGHGRPGARRVLFNAARAAIRSNPIMKTFYDRLVTVNKRPGKVALIAVMRKMLVTLNAIARDRKPWAHAT